MGTQNFSLDFLKQEVTTLKTNNEAAIELFEKSLLELTGLPEIPDWDLSAAFEEVEIIAMEEPPALSKSIRKIG